MRISLYSILIHWRFLTSLGVCLLYLNCINGLQDYEFGSGLLFKKISVREITGGAPPSHADTRQNGGKWFSCLLNLCSRQYLWVIDQACSVKMAGYWTSSFFASVWTEMESRSLKSQQKKQYPADI